MNRILPLLMAGTTISAVAESQRPNVIFMLTDDLGYSDLSCYGATKVNTPHIDKLAAEGLKFNQFFTSASMCSPSRASFLTGAYPQRCGLYTGINQNRAAHWYLGLSTEEITLAEQFKKKDYKTFMVGKWHLGAEPEFHPLKQGFDYYWGLKDNYDHSPEYFDQEKVVYQKTPLDKLTELYTARIKKIINENKDEPFFLYYAHNYPHTPYKAGAKFKGSSKDGVRGDIMQEMDWGVGEMVKALKEAGIAEKTIIIFTSDNGAVKSTYCRPFRGTKLSSFEGGHRVPFIINWPAKIKKGRVLETKLTAMDLFPTLSEIIGEPLPSDRIYDGVSLLPLLKDKSIARKETEPFYYYNSQNLQAVRKGNWKLHLPRELKQVPWWDRSPFNSLKEPVLYNIAQDKGESKNLADKYPEVVSELIKLAETQRGLLGEYLKPGSEQRATGSLFPEIPVYQVSNDWVEKVDAATKAKTIAEHKKRHPGKKLSTRAGSRMSAEASSKKKGAKKKGKKRKK